MRWVGFLLVPLIVAAGATAGAQSGGYGDRRVDAERFRPSASPESIIATDLPTLPGHLGLTVGLLASYADRPLRVRGDFDQDNNEEAYNLVDREFTADLLVSLGLFQFMELSLAMPLHYARARVGYLEGDDIEDEVYIGDIRAGVKLGLWRNSLVAVGAVVRGTIPIADLARDPSDAAFMGSANWVFEPAALVSLRFAPVTIGMSVGYRLRRELHAPQGESTFFVDDEFTYSAGLVADFLDRRLSLLFEAEGAVGVVGLYRDGGGSWYLPLELRAGLRGRPGAGVSITGGGAWGPTDGYGTPLYRVFLGVAWSLERHPCTTGPEDFDSFEDGDFCAERDNDNDGVLDEADGCPNDAEDSDEFVDEDGCPDPDNDADGVLDEPDGCPLEPEDRDGFQDEDGCAEADNDQDGIPDATDACPMDPEDADEFEDEDGCPEPGPEQLNVTITESQILISQRIFFDYDRDTIRPVSMPMLDRVAEALRSTPRIRRVRIEGYTDNVGEDAYNLDLSYRRARAVLEYLVRQGVERGRLTHVGYGETRPVASNDTPEGQAMNRRVEFTILEQLAR